MATTTAVGPTSKAQKKDSVKATRKNNLSNEKQTTEVTTSDHFSDQKNKGYQSWLERDEHYRVTEGDLGYGRWIEERPETYAMIRLIKRSAIKADSYKTYEKEANIIPPFTRFFLQRTSFANQEKYQIIETFGDFKIFLYGKRPVIKQYGGYLLNTKNNEWMTDFEYVYENYLRGTQAVRHNAITYLTFDNVIIEGYIIMANFNREAIDPNGIPFSFQMIITNKTPIDLVGTKYRNREITDTRSKKQIEDNEKKLPQTAINIIREFLDNKKFTGVYPVD